VRRFRKGYPPYSTNGQDSLIRNGKDTPFVDKINTKVGEID